MPHNDYAELVAQYPISISLPTIDRPHRPSRGSLAEVGERTDLPSRLLFGDLVDDSFRKEAGGWSANYRDGFGNGIDLKVSDGRFEARPFFFGSESYSVGPAKCREAFMQLINLGGDQWARVLKQHLEALYPVNVADSIEGLPIALYVPDGWLRTLLIPVPADRLGDVLRIHRDLSNDALIGAALTSSIALQMQVINYVEGRSPEGCGDPMSLIVRHLLSSNTPLLAQPVREEGKDGTSAWTLRRMAYLYRCSCFLRDVPRIMEKLDAAQLLSGEPDLCAAVVPTELILAAEHSSWWSGKRECRSTWAGFKDQMEATTSAEQTTPEDAAALVRRAHSASVAHTAFFSLVSGE